MTLRDKQDGSFVNDYRFAIGMKLFNTCQWYKSHDVFEEIWHETGEPERQLLQGILQVAVAQVHLENNNINGVIRTDASPDHFIDFSAARSAAGEKTSKTMISRGGAERRRGKNI